ncbi:MAG: ABC transporter ATP-binding protein [Kosmotoga sp.]|uniref:ABC transporter ATP-binding protein n=1 Tax=Kosmotoga sp. TaxID=1955248 RepID=UPI0025BD6D44|nr:ABC transporter ATP-binding protein [Kosmotoga sp.]MCD6159796.1 ABC transporter ATP-binding protein [Kosmotoga sp.]
MPTAIEVKQLVKHYGTVKAVDGISFNVKIGECLAILGPNGAGKTTTVEILEGLRKPDSGNIFYFESEVHKVGKEIKDVIGVQLQTSSFMDYLTVKETIKLFGGLYTKSLSPEDLIQLVELNEKSRTLVKNLSGGQKQRLALAVALVNDPRILFLDEPTTGLDPQARRLLWDTILKLKARKKTIVLTTHYMEEAEQLADRIVIIDHGKIVASGTLDDLIKTVKENQFIEFRLPNSYGDETIFNKLREHFPGLKLSDDGKFICPTLDIETSLEKIFNLLGSLNSKVENIVIRKPNLEDVFLKLTGHSLRD